VKNELHYMSKTTSVSRLFHFKQFSLAHHNSSMRVGTDAILLGLFAASPSSVRTLEIGTGCGIISLLIASRSKCPVDAVDIDEDSVEEAITNFSNSPFHTRMKAIHSDFNEYAKNQERKYDLIVSNPPFFINDFRPENPKKRTTRHSEQLTYAQIAEGTIRLLETKGKLCLVLPYEESREFLSIAENNDLHLQRQQLIFPVRGLQPNRVNLQFGFERPNEVQTEKLTIREENGSFTGEYVELLIDYYIALK
jgi:tRNA1Val (adenine37-N6)-methyltransferase